MTVGHVMSFQTLPTTAASGIQPSIAAVNPQPTGEPIGYYYSNNVIVLFNPNNAIQTGWFIMYLILYSSYFCMI